MGTPGLTDGITSENQSPSADKSRFYRTLNRWLSKTGTFLGKLLGVVMVVIAILTTYFQTKENSIAARAQRAQEAFTATASLVSGESDLKRLAGVRESGHAFERAIIANDIDTASSYYGLLLTAAEDDVDRVRELAVDTAGRGLDFLEQELNENRMTQIECISLCKGLFNATCATNKRRFERLRSLADTPETAKELKGQHIKNITCEGTAKRLDATTALQIINYLVAVPPRAISGTSISASTEWSIVVRTSDLICQLISIFRSVKMNKSTLVLDATGCLIHNLDLSDVPLPNLNMTSRSVNYGKLMQNGPDFKDRNLKLVLGQGSFVAFATFAPTGAYPTYVITGVERMALFGCNFYGVRLATYLQTASKLHFDGASDTKLDDSSYTAVSFQSCWMQTSDLKGLDFPSCDFRLADLRGAHLDGTSFLTATGKECAIDDSIMKATATFANYPETNTSETLKDAMTQHFKN